MKVKEATTVILSDDEIRNALYRYIKDGVEKGLIIDNGFTGTDMMMDLDIAIENSVAVSMCGINKPNYNATLMFKKILS